MGVTYDKAVRINNAAASGDLTVVAATTGLSTKVYGLRLSAAGTVAVAIKRGSTTLEVVNLVAGIPFVLPLREKDPYYQTATNEAFIVSPGGAVQVDGVAEFTTS